MTAARFASPEATRSAFMKSLSSPPVNATMRLQPRSSTATSVLFGTTMRATSAMISAAAAIDSVTRPLRFGSVYESWLVPSAKSPRNGASEILKTFATSTVTPGLCARISASETSGFVAPKSNCRWRRAFAATAAARCAAFAPRPVGSERKFAPWRNVSSPRSVSRGNALESSISASRRTSSDIAESKSSFLTRRRSNAFEKSNFTPYAASWPIAWHACKTPRRCIELSAMAAKSEPFRVSDTATVISPRGPPSRNTR